MPIELPDNVWPDEATLLAVWPDIIDLEDDTITVLVGAAQVQCEAFAPVLAEDAEVPVTYKMAVAMQTRNLWNATEVSPGGETGEGDFVVRPFPMDWHVKSLLRPKRGRPLVG
jgi:hypothetical protein